MNSLLISNPCLFLPSSTNNSVEEEELRQTFLAYEKRQFEEAWRAASLESNSSNKTASSQKSNIFSTPKKINPVISSPTITSSSTVSCYPEEASLNLDEILSLDSMDNWQSMSLFGGGGDLEKQFYNFENLETEVNSNKPEPTCEANIDSLNVPEFGSDFDNESLEHLMSILDDGKELEWDGFKNPEDSSKPTYAVSNSAFQNGLGLAENSTASLTLNYLQAQQKSIEESTLNFQNQLSVAQAPSTSTTVTATPTSTITSAPRLTHKRKATIEERVIAPSPAHTENEESSSMEDHKDLKPLIPALGINNGQTRRRSSAVASPHDGESSSRSRSSNGKRLRKYELPDTDDPTVKNAKAAKMNRDRKKREMADLKEANEKIKSEFDQLAAQLQAERNARLQAEKALAEEREKNELNADLSNHCSNLKDVLEGVVEGLNQKFQRPFKVEVDNRFASIPASVLETGGVLACFPNSQNEDLESEDGSFNILAPEYQMGAAEESAQIRNNAEIFQDNNIPMEVDTQKGVVRIFSNKPNSRKLLNAWRRIREINRSLIDTTKALVNQEEIKFENDGEDTVMYDEEQIGFVKDHSELLSVTNLLTD